jgi:Tfp pilus assembly protein PilF
MVGLVLIATTLTPEQGTNPGEARIVRISREAAEAYRAGDQPRALAILTSLSPRERELSLNAVRNDEWPPHLLRALGALYMEAALVARRSSLDADQTAHHVALATSVFDILTARTGRDDHSAARWVLVITLEQMRAGQYRAAQSLVEGACRSDIRYAPVLIACGTVRETLSAFPSDALSVAYGYRSPSTQFEASEITFRPPATLVRLRAERNDHLHAARRYFERALQVEANSREAALRLAAVRLQQGDREEGMRRLERFLAQPGLTDREQYLARLFLARAMSAAGHLDAAEALLASAAPRQSALLARAGIALQRGAPEAAAAWVERATQPAENDPWWLYRYGQYWLSAALVGELRLQARQ